MQIPRLIRRCPRFRPKCHSPARILILACSRSILFESSGLHLELGERGGAGALANNVATTGASLNVEDIARLVGGGG